MAPSQTERQIGAKPVGPLMLLFTPTDGGSLLYHHANYYTLASLPDTTIQTRPCDTFLLCHLRVDVPLKFRICVSCFNKEQSAGWSSTQKYHKNKIIKKKLKKYCVDVQGFNVVLSPHRGVATLGHHIVTTPAGGVGTGFVQGPTATLLGQTTSMSNI